MKKKVILRQPPTVIIMKLIWRRSLNDNLNISKCLIICNSETSKVSRFLGISTLVLQKKIRNPDRRKPVLVADRILVYRMPMYTKSNAPQKMSFPWLIHVCVIRPQHCMKSPGRAIQILKNLPPGIPRKSHQIPWIFMKSPWFRPPFFCEKKTSPLEIALPLTSQSCAAAKYHSHGCHEAWSTGTVFMQQFFDVSSVQSFNVYSGSDQLTETVSTYWGFRKWRYPTTMGFPTKNDHFGVFWGYHHFRKHPYNSGPKTKTTCLPPESHDAWKIMIVYFRNGPFFQGTS